MNVLYWEVPIWTKYSTCSLTSARQKAVTLNISAPTPILVSSANLQRVFSWPPSRMLIKSLRNIGPSDETSVPERCHQQQATSWTLAFPRNFLFLFLWLEMALRRTCSIIFPQTEVPQNVLLAVLEDGLYAFLQSSGKSLSAMPYQSQLPQDLQLHHIWLCGLVSCSVLPMVFIIIETTDL